MSDQHPNSNFLISNSQELQMLQIARRLYSYRRIRDRIFNADSVTFRDPSWDLLLELFIAKVEDRQVMTSVVIASIGAPYTTALRHLNDLAKKGMVTRSSDQKDGRCSIIALTDRAYRCLLQFFDAIDQSQPIAS